MRSVGAIAVSLLLLIASVASAPWPVDAAAFSGPFYVAPDGSNANPGTRERPWRTIQHAANRLRAGQTVYIRTGIYRERVRPKFSGARGRMISYRAYPGELPTIDGARILLEGGQAGLFEIAGRAWIRVSGLRIINARPHANSNRILVVDSHDILLEGNRTANSRSSGIGVRRSRGVTIRDTPAAKTTTAGRDESLFTAGAAAP